MFPTCFIANYAMSGEAETGMRSREITRLCRGELRRRMAQAPAPANAAGSEAAAPCDPAPASGAGNAGRPANRTMPSPTCAVRRRPAPPPAASSGPAAPWAQHSDRPPRFSHLNRNGQERTAYPGRKRTALMEQLPLMEQIGAVATDGADTGKGGRVASRRRRPPAESQDAGSMNPIVADGSVTGSG